ncbi:MAG TPA: class I SAM-dependent methyltransferase, partial [Dongiaceae bacterium]|nr:class I SAM-dependent methyltransferase [Dongiaceae bacterium]
DRELGHPIRVDFLHGKTGFRSQRFQHEMIVKAVAGRSRDPLTVLDCTAGLGRDGFLLAAAGFSVTLVERHPAVACLLFDGLWRAAQDLETAPVCARIRTHLGSALDYLASLTEAERPDVICVDPMFPERTKAALVKKEMRLFRAVVGDDTDAEALLALAMQRARKRVVVKRPRKAEFIGGRKPGHQLEGTSSRFDVYVV